MKSKQFYFLMAVNIVAAFISQAQPPYVAKRIEYHNGNSFLFPASTLDTIEIQDPITNETIQLLRKSADSRPLAINGKKIYNNAEVTTPVERRNDIIPFSFEEYVLNKIKPDLATLRDGSYHLHLGDIVVDKRGDVQYYTARLTTQERILVSKAPYPEPAYFYTEREAAGDTLATVHHALDKVMHGPLFVPAKIGHKKVAAVYESYTSNFEILVKNHEVTFKRDKTFPTVKPNM